MIDLWLAYDHPFEDGNGRTARMLFYWSLLNQGYWLAEFVSISRILLQAPARYARSFLLTETDDLDATYVLHYQLEVARRAVEDLHTYLDKTVDEMNQVEAALRADSGLNHRQIALLGHAAPASRTRLHVRLAQGQPPGGVPDRTDGSAGSRRPRPACQVEAWERVGVPFAC